jgi:hypothetical protein
MRAGGTRNNEIIGGGGRRFLAAQFGALLLPAKLHHFRQAVDHHIQEAADHQPEKYPHANECGGNRLQEFQETHWLERGVGSGK